MNSDTEILSDPSDETLADLAAARPDNPFCTAAYIRARGGDARPVVFQAGRGSEFFTGCVGFRRSGRLNADLEVPSIPEIPAKHALWRTLSGYCSRTGVTSLALNSFASRMTDIPELSKDMRCWSRREYWLPLDGDNPFRGMKKGHKYRVKRATKGEVRLVESSGREECVRHLELIDSSMMRRRQRGEAVSGAGELSGYMALLDSGAGRLYQCVDSRGETLSSNLVLLAARAGYSHTQGTSAEGRTCGAAHFMVCRIAERLREEGLSWFNLGATRDTETGLAEFKSGFSADMETVDVEAARVAVGGQMYRTSARVKRMLGLQA